MRAQVTVGEDWAGAAIMAGRRGRELWRGDASNSADDAQVTASRPGKAKGPHGVANSFFNWDEPMQNLASTSSLPLLDYSAFSSDKIDSSRSHIRE